MGSNPPGNAKKHVENISIGGNRTRRRGLSLRVAADVSFLDVCAAPSALARRYSATCRKLITEVTHDRRSVGETPTCWKISQNRRDRISGRALFVSLHLSPASTDSSFPDHLVSAILSVPFPRPLALKPFHGKLELY